MKMIKSILNRIHKYFSGLFLQKSKKEEYTVYDLVPQLKETDTNELYERIMPGDIIMAVTPKPLEMLSTMDLSHRVRPYIVAKKENNVITAYCGTSNSRASFKCFFDLNRDDYAVSKDGKIRLTKAFEITPDRILSVIDHLSYSDILKINEELYLCSHCRNCQPIDISKEIREGQIIRFEKDLYIAASCIGETVKACRLLPGADGGHSVVHRNNVYHISRKCSFDIPLDSILPTASFCHSLIQRNQTPKQKDPVPDRKTKEEKYRKNHSYSYPPGQIFSIGTRLSIYLFSYEGKEYGVADEDLELGKPKIRKISNMYYSHEDGMLDDAALIDILDRLVYNNSGYKWLFDEIFEVEGEECSNGLCFD